MHTGISYLRVPEMSSKVVGPLPQLQRNDLVHAQRCRMDLLQCREKGVKESRSSGIAGRRFGNLKLKEVSIDQLPYMACPASSDKFCGH